MAEQTYTAEQIATAARELLDASGSDQPEKTWPPEGTLVEGHEYTLTEALDHLVDEVRLLRERGFGDEQIAGLLSGFDIEVTGSELTRHSPRID